MQKIIYKAIGDSFKVDKRIEDAPSNDTFFLHNHDAYEILFFIEGDSKFVIEGKNYFLNPGDLIIVRKHEMHRIYHNSNAKYQRVVLMVSPDFFKIHNCTHYENQFLNVQMGIANRIKFDYVRSSGLHQAFKRLKKYCKVHTPENEPIVIATIIEILYLINQAGNFSSFDENDNHVVQVISYINNHYAQDIDLKTLEKKFYISKSHLCKIFRKVTGLTIHDYIRHKRLSNFQELRQAGKSITEAATLSGFSDYSSFYRTYKKLMGCSPRDSDDTPERIQT